MAETKKDHTGANEQNRSHIVTNGIKVVINKVNAFCINIFLLFFSIGFN